MAGLINPKDLVEGDIFALLGLQNLTEAQQEETMAKLIESVQNKVLIRIDDLVGEADLEAWHRVLDTGSDEEINQFLTSKNINVAQLVAEEALLIKSELVSKIKAEE